MIRSRSKYIVFFLVEILIILILLPGCFKKEEQVYSLAGEDITSFASKQGDSTVFKSIGIEMDPGVYQVRLHTASLQEQYVFVDVQSEEPANHTLATNGVPVFAGNEYTDFEVYVKKHNPAVYICLDSKAISGFGVDRLEIYKLNWGYRLSLLGMSILFAIIDTLLLLHKRIRENKMCTKQQAVFFALVGGVLLAYYPFMREGFFFGYDTTFHLSRIAFLKDTLLQGAEWPIRIQSTWLYDHGYAVSLFYGDLFLMFPAILMILGVPLMSSYKIFVFCVLLMTAGISYFSIKKCVKDEYSALLGSLIYLLSPYFLLDIYSRGAVGEYLAMIFLPLLVSGVYLLFTEDVSGTEYRSYKWYVVVGMSAILQSHLLSTEMTAIFLLLVCIIFCKKALQKQTFLQLLYATGIVLLINAWYWIPMLYMLKSDSYALQHVTTADVQSRGLSLTELLRVFPGKDTMISAAPGHESVQISVAIVILFLLYMAWVCITRRYSRTCNIFLGMFFVACVLCTQYIPWNKMLDVPGIGFVVASIQFPWRWMGLATIFGAYFSAFCYKFVKEYWVGGAISCIALLLSVFLAMYQGNSFYSKGELYLYEEENFGTIQVVSGEYLLEGVDSTDYFYHNPVAAEGVLWSDYVKNGTEITLSLLNTTEELKHIELPLTGYKGYSIEAMSGDKNNIPYVLEDRGTHGDLRIAIPGGYNGQIRVFYKGHVSFLSGEIISVLTLGGVATVALMNWRKRSKNEK